MRIKIILTLWILLRTFLNISVFNYEAYRIIYFFSENFLKIYLFVLLSNFVGDKGIKRIINVCIAYSISLVAIDILIFCNIGTETTFIFAFLQIILTSIFYVFIKQNSRMA
jgi:hypothetical protein